MNLSNLQLKNIFLQHILQIVIKTSTYWPQIYKIENINKNIPKTVGKLT